MYIQRHYQRYMGPISAAELTAFFTELYLDLDYLQRSTLQLNGSLNEALHFNLYSEEDGGMIPATAFDILTLKGKIKAYGAVL